VRALRRLPELIRRIDHYFPAPGAAPPGPPLPDLVVKRRSGGWRLALTGLISAAIGVAATLALT
jgi:ubiquinone biosynthesis protein